MAQFFTDCVHRSREDGKDQGSIQSNTTTYGKVTKTQEHIMRSALSQQVTDRLQGTDKTA